jgi:hypothetical protein
MLQVAEMICGILSSSKMAFDLILSSKLCGRKNLLIAGGMELLKSSSAAQHLVVVDQGAI